MNRIATLMLFVAAAAGCSANGSLDSISSPMSTPKAIVGTSKGDLWGWYQMGQPRPMNGYAATLAHFDGSAWAEVPLPNASAMFNGSSGFPIAAGAPGQVWVMTAWADETDRSQHIALFVIDASGNVVADHSADFPVLSLAQDQGMLYGDYSLASHGGVIAAAAPRPGATPSTSIMVYSSQGSTHLDGPPGAYLGQVFLVAPNNLYGISTMGTAATPAGELYHYDGTSWTDLQHTSGGNQLSIAPDGEEWLYATNDQLVTVGDMPLTVLHGRNGNLSPLTFPSSQDPSTNGTPLDISGLGGGRVALISRLNTAAGGGPPRHTLVTQTFDGAGLGGAHDLTGTDDCVSDLRCPELVAFGGNLDDGDILMVNPDVTAQTPVPEYFVLPHAAL